MVWLPPRVFCNYSPERRRRLATIQNHLVHHRPATRAASNDCDLTWITSEAADVALDPVQSGAHVKQPSIGSTVVSDFGRGQEPENTKTILYGHVDEIAM